MDSLPDYEIRAVEADRLAEAAKNMALAQEWRDMADARRIEIDARAIARAQQVSARAMAQAQRAMEHSRVKVAYPQSGMPIHINFVAPGQPDFTVVVPNVPELPAPTIN